MTHTIAKLLCSSVLLVSACTDTEGFVAGTDEGALVQAVEAAGCSFDPDNPPAVRYSESYRLNPGMQRTPENDLFWSKVTTRRLVEKGVFVRETSATGGEVVKSTVGGCA